MKSLFRRFRQLLLVLWLFLMIAFGVWFTNDNSQPAQVTIIGFALPQAPLALCLAVTLSIGAFLGWLVTYFSVQKKAFRNKRELKKAQKEVTLLRSSYGSEPGA